ncbi:hypothetical protein MRB53_039662 [Persea americana]|nr:hypothetical protein MRB53_039662 [Persea americana]
MLGHQVRSWGKLLSSKSRGKTRDRCSSRVRRRIPHDRIHIHRGICSMLVDILMQRLQKYGRRILSYPAKRNGGSLPKAKFTSSSIQNKYNIVDCVEYQTQIVVSYNVNLVHEIVAVLSKARSKLRSPGRRPVYPVQVHLLG